MATSPRLSLGSPRVELSHVPIPTPAGLVSVRMSRQMTDAIRRQKLGTAAIGYWAPPESTVPSNALPSNPSPTPRPVSRARSSGHFPSLDVLAGAANSVRMGRPRWRSQSMPRLPRPITTHDVIRHARALPMATHECPDVQPRSGSTDRGRKGKDNLTCMQLTDAILNTPAEATNLYALCGTRMRYVDFLEDKMAAMEEKEQEEARKTTSAEKPASKNGCPKPTGSKQSEATVSALLRAQSGQRGSHLPPSSSPSPHPVRFRDDPATSIQVSVNGTCGSSASRVPATPPIPKLRLNHAESKIDGGMDGSRDVTTLPSPRPLSRDRSQSELFRQAVLQRYNTTEITRTPPGGDLVVRGTLVPLEEADRGVTPATPRTNHVTASGTVRRYVTPSKVGVIPPRNPKRRGVRFSKSDLVYEFLPLEALPD